MTILASDPDQAMSVDETGIAAARRYGLVLRSEFGSGGHPTRLSALQVLAYFKYAPLVARGDPRAAPPASPERILKRSLNHQPH